MVKVAKDEKTGKWYYIAVNGFQSEPIFANRKKAWAKGNEYVDFFIRKNHDNYTQLVKAKSAPKERRNARI